MLSFFDRFLKYTTTFASDMVEKSGGSVTWESCDELVPNAGVDEPKPPNALVAARALLAWALFGRLLMVEELSRCVKRAAPDEKRKQAEGTNAWRKRKCALR